METVIDFKTISVDPKGFHKGVQLNDDGTLTLDLDLLFGEDIESSRYDYEKGYFNRNHFGPFKLAANARVHRSPQFGEAVIHDYYSFGGWDETGEGRIVDNGPMVPGPQAYMFELGVAITAHKQPDTIAFYIETGDKVILRGTTYIVTFNKRNKYPVLVAL